MARVRKETRDTGIDYPAMYLGTSTFGFSSFRDAVKWLLETDQELTPHTQLRYEINMTSSGGVVQPFPMPQDLRRMPDIIERIVRALSC